MSDRCIAKLFENGWDTPYMIEEMKYLYQDSPSVLQKVYVVEDLVRAVLKQPVLPSSLEAVQSVPVKQTAWYKLCEHCKAIGSKQHPYHQLFRMNEDDFQQWRQISENIKNGTARNVHKSHGYFTHPLVEHQWSIGSFLDKMIQVDKMKYGNKRRFLVQTDSNATVTFFQLSKWFSMMQLHRETPYFLPQESKLSQKHHGEEIEDPVFVDPFSFGLFLLWVSDAFRGVNNETTVLQFREQYPFLTSVMLQLGYYPHLLSDDKQRKHTLASSSDETPIQIQTQTWSSSQTVKSPYPLRSPLRRSTSRSNTRTPSSEFANLSVNPVEEDSIISMNDD